MILSLNLQSILEKYILNNLKSYDVEDLIDNKSARKFNARLDLTNSSLRVWHWRFCYFISNTFLFLHHHRKCFKDEIGKQIWIIQFWFEQYWFMNYFWLSICFRLKLGFGWKKIFLFVICWCGQIVRSLLLLLFWINWFYSFSDLWMLSQFHQKNSVNLS